MVENLERRILDPRTAEEREIAELGPWFHNLHLPDGTQTAPDHPLGDFPAFKWRQIESHIPEDLTGWSVLDIGCNAGFYAFELARRGASVTGIDTERRYLRQAEWAARRFGLEDRVRFEELQVYDLARRSGTYDLVLFLGVFYHLRYPLLALDIVSRRAERLLAFQTLTLPGMKVRSAAELRLSQRRRLLSRGWPKMAFVERRLAGDPTNWWVPNHAAIEAMLRSCGMRVTARPGHEIYLCVKDETVVSSETREQDLAQLRAATGAPAELLPS